MVSQVEQIDIWRASPSEHQGLEFKEAALQFDNKKLFKYCVAIANEGGGHLLLGIQDKPPRKVVGTSAFSDPMAMAAKLLDVLGFRVDIEEVDHPGGRVLVFSIPSRPRGTAFQYEGAYWMRSGDRLTCMTEDRLRSIFAEGEPDWLEQIASVSLVADEVIARLNVQAYFDLLGVPYPTSQDAVLERLAAERLISVDVGGWSITNLAAILLAKKLDAFPQAVARKAPRFIIYVGADKLKTKTDITWYQGYAVGFEALVELIHASAPQNQYVEEAIRQETKMFPVQALRELIANALVHQDFSMTGTSVVIEMYNDRIEIASPGLPTIAPERFIDEYRSRNERLAELMRRLGICEEKGSGIDKVILAVEAFQLPAPDFRVGEVHTRAVLFAHQDFLRMSRADRVRACYQHCVLQYLSGRRMSNQTLRARFGLDGSASSSATTSQIIAMAKEAKLVKAGETQSGSNRYANYLPWWA